MVEMVHPSTGTLVCCSKPMVLLTANTTDAAKEKHVPVIERSAGAGLKVKVGSVPHPMEEKHYIEWIEIIVDGKACRKFLKPGQAPEATFCGSDRVVAREFCNLHGLWKAEG